MSNDICTRILLDLQALGDTAEEVAQSLRKEGITGDTKGASCPIFNYLSRKGYPVRWAGTHSVSIQLEDNGYDVRYASDHSLSKQHYSHIQSYPSPVAKFIYQFDDGKYSDLHSST